MTLMRKNTVVFLLSMGCSLLVLSTLRAQDAKIVADNLEYSREFYSGVHFSAIAESEPSFGYQRYPDDGPERIQCNAGTFARQHGKPWLRSEDWGQSGRPVDQQMARKLDGRVKLVDAALAFAPSEVKLINKSEAGHRVQWLFEARGANETGAPVRLEFEKPLYDKNPNVLLHGFEGSLPIAGGKAVRSERVKLSFGYLIAQGGFELSEAAWENLETPKDPENKPIDLSNFDIGPKPKGAEGFLNRASARRFNGDVNGAIADYNRAIELDPKNASAFNSRGMLKKSKGDLDGAITDFNSAIELNENFAIAYKNRGDAKQAKGDAAGAKEDLKRAGELDPRLRDEESSADHVDRGTAKGKETKSAASVEDFFNRAGVKKAAGDLDGAIADYDRAIQLDPKDAAIYNNRGLAKQEKGDLEAAIVDFNRAIQLNPKDAVACSNLGNAKRDKGDLDGAILDYNRAIRFDPKYAYAYYDRGLAKKQKSDLDGAIADYNRVIELDPRFAK